MRLIALVIALTPLPALAANVTWTNPTSGTQDGVTVPVVAADIASTTIEYSNGTTFGAVAGQVVVAGSGTSGVAPDPAPGASRCYRARTTLVAAKGGLTSGPSNVDCKAVPPGPVQPNPPTLLQVLLAWLRSIFGRFA